MQLAMADTTRPSVTMREVAQRAGLSQATVSRALSGRGYSSEDSREKALRAAQELGYHLDARARSLKLQRTHTIGLMIQEIVNPFYSYLANGVLACAREYGFHVVVCASDENPSLEREYLEVLIQQRVDGIIAVPTGENLELWKDLVSRNTSLVFMDRGLSGLTNTNTVLVDNAGGAFQAINYLIDLGHRRIAIITGSLQTTTGLERYEGYVKALKDAGYPIERDLIKIGDFKKGSGIRATAELLQLTDRPTAIFAANNRLGEAVVQTLTEHGLRIAHDISVIMFDDVQWASMMSPSISVVAQPTYQLGFLSMRCLHERLQWPQDERYSSQKVVLDSRLIIRDSCAPPRCIPGSAHAVATPEMISAGSDIEPAMNRPRKGGVDRKTSSG